MRLNVIIYPTNHKVEMNLPLLLKKLCYKEQNKNKKKKQKPKTIFLCISINGIIPSGMSAIQSSWLIGKWGDLTRGRLARISLLSNPCGI
jgi:hypothetical protein